MTPKLCDELAAIASTPPDGELARKLIAVYVFEREIEIVQEHDRARRVSRFS
jgi:hypothetical protein